MIAMGRGEEDLDSGPVQEEGTRRMGNWETTRRAGTTRRRRVILTCSLLRCVFSPFFPSFPSSKPLTDCLRHPFPLSPLIAHRATSSNLPRTGSPKPFSRSTTRTTSSAGCASSSPSLLPLSVTDPLRLRSIYIIPVLALLWIPAIVQFTSKNGATVWGVKLVWWSIWLTVVWCGWWGAALGAFCFLFSSFSLFFFGGRS